MKRIITFCVSLACLAVVFATQAQAAPKAVKQTKGNIVVAQLVQDAEESVRGGDILNPMPGEQITDPQPMIGVKIPQLDPPIKPDTIVISIDGDDVTSETQVTIEYIFYTPAMALKPGIHNVKVTYSYLDDSVAPPVERPYPSISWDFEVVTSLAAIRKPVAGQEKRVSTSGKLSLTAGNVFLNEGTRIYNANSAPSDLKYKESGILTPIIDVTHEHHGETIVAHYDRSIEEITGRPNDRGYAKFTDLSKEIILGDYPTTSKEFSEYTISGVRIRGMKNTQMTPHGKLTFFSGRSQEPQDGLMLRYTIGSMFEFPSTPSYTGKVIALRTREKGLATAAASPKRDLLISIVNKYKYSPSFAVYSEMATDYHSETGVAGVARRDSATKFEAAYVPKPFSLVVGRRTVGPSFTPTTLGTFTERDREGTYGTLKYTPSKRWALSSFFDDYHNNLHHNANINDFTDKTTNSISSITYSTNMISMLNYRYNKLYAKTDIGSRAPGIQNTLMNESTTEALTLKVNLPDVKAFIDNTYSMVYTRYDIDRFTNTTGTASNLAMRSDTRNYTVGTRYKALWQLSYNFTINRANTHTISTTDTQDDAETTTDSWALRYNLTQKLVFNFKMRRSAKNTNTTNYTTGQTALSSSVLEYAHEFSLAWTMTDKRKLTFNLINFDRQYRETLGSGRAYDERRATLTYDLSF